MNFQELLKQFSTVEAKIHYKAKNQTLVASALVHRSFLNENKDVPVDHNERLEFLGDSVLNLIVAQYLFESLPGTQEGELSTIRSHAVSSQACLGYMKSLDIHDFILVGKGEKTQAAKGRTSILADTFEALLGAIYLDGGIESARQFFLDHFSYALHEIWKKPSKNFKAELQEYVQKELHIMPQYRVLQETGPDHDRHFEIGVYIDEKLVGTGQGSTKKEAEQQAAGVALQTIAPKK